jgi:pimeloyl-ACP methyl ester carboxylesterase
MPVTFLYGAKSWIAPTPGYAFQEQYPTRKTTVSNCLQRLLTYMLTIPACMQVHLIPNAGHHVLWDNAKGLNAALLVVADEVKAKV